LIFGYYTWYIKLRQPNERVRNRALENVWNSNQKAVIAFFIQFSFSKCRKVKNIFIGSQQSIDIGRGGQLQFRLRDDDEDQDISEKEDTGKEDEDDEDKKYDSFYFCNKKIKTTDNVC